MDRLDKKIMTSLGREFPIHPRPYQEIARQLSLDEQEVIERVSTLLEGGMIKRVGAIIDPHKIGFVSTLVAVSVPEGELGPIVEFLNAHPGVTHNYLRTHEYNLWFTLIVPERDEITRILGEIESRFGSKPIELPMSKRYKIGVKLDIE